MAKKNIIIRNECAPIWNTLMTAQGSFAHLQLTPEQKQVYLQALDEIHDFLSLAIEITEKISDEIQMSLPKDPNSGDVVSEQEPVPPP